MKLVPYDSVKNPSLYYGAPCMPTVKGVLWECANRAEYNEMRDAYETQEGNCNTCLHLVRPPPGQPKDKTGFLKGTCAKKGTALYFHPEDPLQLPCHEQRTRKVTA